LSYGLGFAYRLDAAWAIRADWDRFRNIGRTFNFSVDTNGKFDNVDLLSVVVEYHFP